MIKELLSCAFLSLLIKVASAQPPTIGGYNVYYYNDGYYRGDNNKGYFDEANNRGWTVGASGAGDDHTGT